MRIPATLLIGTSVLAIAVPATRKPLQEQTAQAVNPPASRRPRRRRRPRARSSSPRPSAHRRVQDVPFSINAQTEEDIQRANAKTIEDISRNVAGLTVQNLGPGQSQVSSAASPPGRSSATSRA